MYVCVCVATLPFEISAYVCLVFCMLIVEVLCSSRCASEVDDIFSSPLKIKSVMRRKRTSGKKESLSRFAALERASCAQMLLCSSRP